MLQADVEIQLKVWKDLAISKQILMAAATKALGLDPECSTEDLRSALTNAIKRAEEADSKVAEMREQTSNELAEMRAQVASSEKTLAEAQEQLAQAITARETAERQATVGKSENAEALKKAKADVADKQSKLTAISIALADTPDNVVKKLKALKKAKLDDAKARAAIETQLRNTRKDKTKLEQDIEAKKDQLKQVAPLLESVREMRTLCERANEKITSLSDDEKDLIEIPKLDDELLESLEKAASAE